MMEKEHMIISGLLVAIAILSYFTFRQCKKCDQMKKEGFGLAAPYEAQNAYIRHRYGIPGDAVETTNAHIRSREGFGIPGDDVATTNAHIRTREGFGIEGNEMKAHINVDNSMQASQHVQHHLRRDHRNKMLRNMIFGQ